MILCLLDRSSPALALGMTWLGDWGPHDLGEPEVPPPWSPPALWTGPSWNMVRASHGRDLNQSGCLETKWDNVFPRFLEKNIETSFQKCWNPLLFFLPQRSNFFGKHSWVTRLYQFQVHSRVIQLYIYVFFFRFFFITHYYKIRNTVPCDTQ